MASQIIIGIPGLWEARSGIVHSIAKTSDAKEGSGFFFAGTVLLEIATQIGYTLEVYEPDPGLENAFEIAGQGSIAQSDLELISQHTFTLYVTKDDPSLEAAKGMLRAGRALLKAGGIAVKVESAGIAHSAQQWLQISDSTDPFDFYRAYVTLVRGETTYYSCGMQNFGLADSSIPIRIDSATAATLLNQFNIYQLAEQPSLGNGHTFSVSATSPRFRLKKEKCRWYEVDNPLHNSFGCWHLEPI